MRPSSNVDADDPIVGLVVDQDPTVRSVIRKIFERRQGSILSAETAAEAAELLRSRQLDAVFVQPGAPGAAASAWLDPVVHRVQAPILVELSGAIDLAAELSGYVFERVPAGADPDSIEACIDRLLEMIRLRRENRHLRHRLQSGEGYRKLVGRSEAISRIRDRLEPLVSNLGPVWIHGEPGTGRKRVAHELHRKSPDVDRPMIRCRASNLNRPEGWKRLEMELTARGVAAGAVLLENPEVLDLAAQQRWREMLRSYPEIAWRIVSTLDPSSGIDQGLLHSDWIEIADESVVNLPLLRERPEDIPLLASHFLSDIAEINQLPEVHIAPEALKAMERYSWPGNVAELRNCIEHAVILASAGELRADDLPDRVRESARGSQDRPPEFREAKRQVVSRFECEFLTDLMRRQRGNVTAAALSAGMLRSALQRLLRKHRLKSSQFRAGVALPSEAMARDASSVTDES